MPAATENIPISDALQATVIRANPLDLGWLLDLVVVVIIVVCVFLFLRKVMNRRNQAVKSKDANKTSEVQANENQY